MTLPYYCVNILLIFSCILTVWFSFRKKEQACNVVRIVDLLAIIILAIADKLFLRRVLNIDEFYTINELNDRTILMLVFTFFFPIITRYIFKVINHENTDKKSY